MSEKFECLLYICRLLLLILSFSCLIMKHPDISKRELMLIQQDGFVKCSLWNCSCQREICISALAQTWVFVASMLSSHAHLLEKEKIEIWNQEEDSSWPKSLLNTEIQMNRHCLGVFLEQPLTCYRYLGTEESKHCGSSWQALSLIGFLSSVLCWDVFCLSLYNICIWPLASSRVPNQFPFCACKKINFKEEKPPRILNFIPLH